MRESMIQSRSFGTGKNLGFDWRAIRCYNPRVNYPPWNYCGPWKWIIGRWICFWECVFSGATLVLGRVIQQGISCAPPVRELLELDRRNHFASSFQFNFMVVFMTLANTVLIGRMSNGQGVFSAFCQILLLFFVKPPVSNARHRRLTNQPPVGSKPDPTNETSAFNEKKSHAGLESDHSRGFRFGHSEWGLNLGNHDRWNGWWFVFGHDPTEKIWISCEITQFIRFEF